MLLGDKAFLPPPSLRPEASCRPSCCYSGGPPGLTRAPPSFPPAALAATWEAPSSWRKWAKRLRVPRGLPQARSSAGGGPIPRAGLRGSCGLKTKPVPHSQVPGRAGGAQAERAMATLLTRVCEAAGRFPMSRWQTRTPQLSPARAGSGPKAGSSGRWRTCQGPLGNSLGDPRPVAGLLTSPH